MTYIALAVSALLVVVDQLIKFAVDSNMDVLESIPVLKDVLHWTYVQNEGAAFGMFPGQKWLLIGLTSVVLIGLLAALIMKKIKHPFLIWSLSLIIGGGIGNLIDRIFRNFVIDYIEVRLINFAIFNFADCCVVIGTIMLIGYLLFGELWKERKGKKSNAGASEQANDVLQDTVTVDLDENHDE